MRTKQPIDGIDGVPFECGPDDHGEHCFALDDHNFALDDHDFTADDHNLAGAAPDDDAAPKPTDDRAGHHCGTGGDNGADGDHRDYGEPAAGWRCHGR